MKRTHDDMKKDDAVSEHSDVEDEEEEVDAEGKVPPYDAFKEEKLPGSAVYTDDFQKLKQHIKELVDLLLTPIRASEYRNGVIEGLLEEVKQRSKGGFPENICVALIGEMAAGKSSVINSVLSIGMIARQGDGCGSCTWVTQEFCYRLPKQTMSYAAEIHFFDHEGRKGILASMLADYYHASPKNEDIAPAAKDGDQNVEDYTVMKTTVDALRALFSDHKSFRTTQDAHKFLQQMNGPDDSSMLSLLCNWADELMSKELCTKDHVFREASTTQSLLFDIGPFCYTVGERDGMQTLCPWPFVSYIKFGLEHPLLKHGITLLDVPGLSDSNKIRVSNALLHLRRCTHGIVVAEIGRAADKSFIRQHLTKGFLERGSGRTMLVLTHADEIDEATDVVLTAKEREKMRDIQEAVTQLDDERREILKKIKSTKAPKKYEYLGKRDTVDEKMRRAEAEIQELRIAARSRGIEAELREFYTEVTPDPLPLPIFCVGNKAYKKHQAGYSKFDAHPPTLSVKATNHPRLREHLYMVPAEGVINETKYLVETQFPTLLSCFKLFVSKMHMARKSEIESIVHLPQETNEEFITSIFKKIFKDVQKHILDPYKNDEWRWTTEARELCRDWAVKYNTGTHLTFLNNQGTRKGRGKGAVAVSWNFDLLQINQDDVETAFRSFFQALSEYFRPVVRAFTGMVQTMMNAIRSDEHVALMALQPFLAYLYNEKAGIEDIVKGVFRPLHRDISMCMRFAKDESPENHLVKAMADAYKKARVIKGKAGTPKQRVQLFEKEVTKLSGVYMKAHDGLEKQIREILAKHRNALKEAMADFFAGIMRNFNMMCSGNEKEDEAETEIRQKLQKNMVLAQEKLEKQIRPLMKACLGETQAQDGLFVT